MAPTCTARPLRRSSRVRIQFNPEQHYNGAAALKRKTRTWTLEDEQLVVAKKARSERGQLSALLGTFYTSFITKISSILMKKRGKPVKKLAKAKVAAKRAKGRSTGVAAPKQQQAQPAV